MAVNPSREDATRIHFTRRVAERVSPECSADLLWSSIVAAITSGCASVQFCTRLSTSGRRLWRTTIDGKTVFIVYDHSCNMPITVLTDLDREISPQKKAPMSLRRFLDA